MPNGTSAGQYDVLAQGIPNITRQISGLIQHSLTSQLAQRVGQAPTLQAGLMEAAKGGPFPGAVDVSAPEVQQGLQVAQVNEQERLKQGIIQNFGQVAPKMIGEMKQIFNKPKELGLINSLEQRIPFASQDATSAQAWLKDADRIAVELFHGRREFAPIATGARGPFAATAAGAEEKLAKAVSRKLQSIYPKDYEVIGKDLFGQDIKRVRPDTRAAAIEGNFDEWSRFAKKWFPRLFKRAGVTAVPPVSAPTGEPRTMAAPGTPEALAAENPQLAGDIIFQAGGFQQPKTQEESLFQPVTAEFETTAAQSTGAGVPAATAGTAGVQTFANMEEARKARVEGRIKKGDVINVGGKLIPVIN